MFVGTIEVGDLLAVLGIKDFAPGHSRNWVVHDENAGVRARLHWDAEADVIRGDVTEWDADGSHPLLTFDAAVEDDEVEVFCHDDQISDITYDLYSLLEAFAVQIRMMKEI
jgi:hypothetical protein